MVLPRRVSVDSVDISPAGGSSEGTLVGYQRFQHPPSRYTRPRGISCTVRFLFGVIRNRQHISSIIICQLSKFLVRQMEVSFQGGLTL